MTICVSVFACVCALAHLHVYGPVASPWPVCSAGLMQPSDGHFTRPVNVLCVLYGYTYIYEHVHVCGYMCACTLADALPYILICICAPVCVWAGGHVCMAGGADAAATVMAVLAG